MSLSLAHPDYLPSWAWAPFALVALVSLLVLVRDVTRHEPKAELNLEQAVLKAVGFTEWDLLANPGGDRSFNEFFEFLTQQAFEDRLSVWGRVYRGPVLTERLEPIPKEHWRQHEISLIAFIERKAGESWVKYTALDRQIALVDLNFDGREIKLVKRLWRKTHG